MNLKRTSVSELGTPVAKRPLSDMRCFAGNESPSDMSYVAVSHQTVHGEQQI